MQTLQPGSPAPQDFAQCELIQAGGKKVVISSLWQDKPTLFVFLRHFGCIACSELIAELEPHLLQLHQWGLRTILVGNGAERYIEGFVQRYKLGDKHVEIYTDPSLRAFDAAGLKRSLYAAVGPKGAWSAIRAFGRGHRQSSIEGNGAQQGGVMLVSPTGEILYQYANQHLGDHAPITDIVQLTMARTVDKKASYIL
jgi:hypothetical protein